MFLSSLLEAISKKPTVVFTLTETALAGMLKLTMFGSSSSNAQAMALPSASKISISSKS